MKLWHNSKIICIAFSLAFSLSACSTAVFPDIEENEVLVSDSQNRKYIEQSNSLASDKDNIAYEDDDTIQVASTDKGEEISAAKTIPVIKGQPEGYVEEKVVTNDDDLNKLLAQGSPSVKNASTGREFKTVKVDTENKYQTSTDEAEQTHNVEQAPKVYSVTYQVATFLFDNGSSALGVENNSKIKEIVKLAKENDAIISVYGYASSRTRNTDITSHKLANFDVSNKRAESVARALRRAGLSADKITTESLSDTNPAYLEVMPEGERLNRRAEVYISY